MDQQGLLRACQRNGLSTKTQKEEILVKSCFFCGNPNYNLELNAEKGVYHCWACRESGALEYFVNQFLGEDAEIPVRVDSDEAEDYFPSPADELEAETKPAADVGSARRYLEKRGLSLSDIYRLGLQVCVTEDHPFYSRVIFPVREYFTNQLLGYTARTVTNQNPRYLHDLEKVMMAGYRDGAPDSPHVIVEGVIDGIKVNKAGFSAAVLLGTGGVDLREWASMTDYDDEIYIMLDGAAYDHARKLYWTLAEVRDSIDVVELPVDVDPGDLEPEVIEALITT